MNRFLIIIGLLILSCNFSKNERAAITINERANFQDFKTNYFIKCLEIGYDNSPHIKELLKYDHSVMSDFPLGIKGYRLIDSLARLTKLEITNDSLELVDRWKNSEDHINAKRVFQICLKRYDSQWLDTIAMNFASGGEF